MDRIRRRRQSPPPEGWNAIKDMVFGLNMRMKDAENSDCEEGNVQKQLWMVHRANWERSRYVFRLRYKDKTISKELYQWIIEQRYADGDLMSYWLKPGYENLCCVACASRKTGHNGVCVCRVPLSQRANPEVKCFNCGCGGCCSCD